MNCTICDFHWCWVCGQELKNYWHTRQYSLFINCANAPSTCPKTCCFVLSFIMILILMPFLVFLSFSFATIEKINNSCLKKLPKCNIKTKLG